jgi:hypothetical protein
MPGGVRHLRTLTTGDASTTVILLRWNGPDMTVPLIVTTICPAIVAVVESYL